MGIKCQGCRSKLIFQREWNQEVAGRGVGRCVVMEGWVEGELGLMKGWG